MLLQKSRAPSDGRCKLGCLACPTRRSLPSPCPSSAFRIPQDNGIEPLSQSFASSGLVWFPSRASPGPPNAFCRAPKAFQKLAPGIHRPLWKFPIRFHTLREQFGLPRTVRFSSLYPCELRNFPIPECCLDGVGSTCSRMAIQPVGGSRRTRSQTTPVPCPSLSWSRWAPDGPRFPWLRLC